MDDRDRVVRMRTGEGGRYLRAYRDESGALHIHGEDFGPEIALVTSSDSYEWRKTIAADDVAELRELLGGSRDDDILDLIDRGWCGPRADDFERLLRERDIQVTIFVR